MCTRMCVHICVFVCVYTCVCVWQQICQYHCVFTSHMCCPGGKAYGQLKDEQLKSLAEINDVRTYIKIHVTLCIKQLWSGMSVLMKLPFVS